MAELKACPFCGSNSVDPAGWMSNGGKTGPACDDCGATADSVEHWNLRAAQPMSDEFGIAADEVNNLCDDLITGCPDRFEHINTLRALALRSVRPVSEDEARLAFWGAYPEKSSSECDIWMAAFRWARVASRALSALPVSEEGGQVVDETVKINPSHEAADAFWGHWKDVGETHRHGYYEATWGAINAALKVAGICAHPPRQDSGMREVCAQLLERRAKNVGDRRAQIELLDQAKAIRSLPAAEQPDWRGAVHFLFSLGYIWSDGRWIKPGTAKAAAIINPDTGVGVANSVDALLAPPQSGVCEWTADDDGVYNTTCGNAFTFIDGTPADNHMAFCGYCGKTLAAK